MRDEKIKLLIFVITWMDGVAFKSSKKLAKMECELERKRKKTEERGKGKNRALGLDEGVYIG